jgi:hypothetical protein
MRYYRFPDGTVLGEDAFRDISRIVYRYFTGRISGSEFESLMRERGFPRARAYLMYYWIINRIFRVYGGGREVLFCMSLISTGSEDWRRRYLECRIRTKVPDEEVEYIRNYEVEACYVREEAAKMHSAEPIFRCEDIMDIVDFFKAMATKYFESKGYDYMMLYTASWYMGFMISDEEITIPENDRVEVHCEIYDMGSQKRRMRIDRWKDVFYLIPRYWEDLQEACRDFSTQAYSAGYSHYEGKKVRWI